MIARQSTAATFIVGPVLNADGVAVTDCVVGDFKASKNGASPAALNGSATLTHRHTGFYSLALTASDTDTVGTIAITIDDTVNACQPLRVQVVEEAIFDAVYSASATGLLPANVTQFGGSNGTFSGGRPEVNTTHAAGTAWNSGAIGASTLAADTITAAKVATDAVTEIQSGLATASGVSDVETKVDTLLSRITENLFSGITYLSRWLGAIAGKTADTDTRAEINATTAGASYNETTDSQEAIRDRGDAAWITGGGGSGDCPNVEEIAAAVEDVLTGIDITVSATSLVDGEPLRITKGDDYESSATPSTAIVMTLTGTGLHSTTGDTWKLWLNTPGADPVETTAVATSSATNSLTLTFELTKTQTDTLTTIAGGTWTVRQVTATTAYKSAKKSGRLIVIPNPETERAA